MQQITAAEFGVEVLKSSLPVLVDFYTETCPPCRRMLPTLLEIESELASKVKIVKVDAGVEVELASQFNIRSVPSLYLYRNGECVGQKVGERSKKEILAWLEQL